MTPTELHDQLKALAEKYEKKPEHFLAVETHNAYFIANCVLDNLPAILAALRDAERMKLLREWNAIDWDLISALVPKGFQFENDRIELLDAAIEGSKK